MGIMTILLKGIRERINEVSIPSNIKPAKLGVGTQSARSTDQATTIKFNVSNVNATHPSRGLQKPINLDINSSPCSKVKPGLSNGFSLVILTDYLEPKWRANHGLSNL